MKARLMDSNILVMAGLCRLIWAARAHASGDRNLPLWQMDAAMLVQKLRGNSVSDLETGRLLTIVHEAVLLERSVEHHQINVALKQLQALLAACKPTPTRSAPLPPNAPLFHIEPRDTVGLPGQVYMLWAGAHRTEALLNGKVGPWVILSPPDSAHGVAGQLTSVTAFWMRTQQEIHTRWMLTLHHRVRITAKLPHDRVCYQLAPQVLSEQKVDALLERVRAMPHLPDGGLHRLEELSQRDPTLSAYTAQGWLGTPGNRDNYESAIELLKDGSAAKPLRLLLR
jgi:hypothetical protein